jgi:predicted DsbA family dithiol-disulfide isomerase
VVPLLEEALARHAPNVRLVHKFYPLKSHKRAEPAARAAFAAKAQGKYWEMEHLLFANQQALEEQDLLNYARKIGLNVDRFRADMESEQATQAIARDQEAADRAGLKGTPFILINGREFDLALFSPLTDLDPWITTEVKLRGGAVKPATGSAP